MSLEDISFFDIIAISISSISEIPIRNIVYIHLRYNYKYKVHAWT